MGVKILFLYLLRLIILLLSLGILGCHVGMSLTKQEANRILLLSQLHAYSFSTFSNI